MRASEFLAAMKAAEHVGDAEKAVEQAVTALLRGYFTRYYPRDVVSLSYPHHTDGVLTVTAHGDAVPRVAVLVEAKRDLDFSTRRINVVQVTAQVLGYLHRIRAAGDIVPAVTVVADNNEIFALPTSLLRKHLDGDHQWHLAPSALPNNDMALLTALDRDPNLLPYIHRIDQTFDVDRFCGNVVLMAEGDEPERIAVTPESLTKAFTNFRFDVTGGAASDVDSREAIRLFVAGLTGDPNVYPHPNKPVLVRNGHEVPGIDPHGWEKFWSAYDKGNYSLSEVKAITEIADTLIEETDRRFRGDFWTPKRWVDEAHATMERELGEDYLDRYVFWDMAAGSLNLTRDYRFTELYSSTLNQTELDIAAGYNMEATKFQYDFLNDDMDLHKLTRQDFLDDPSLVDRFKVPSELLQAMVDQRPIVFFANPPYGQATSYDGKKMKAGVAATAMTDMMSGLGTAAKELYTQFIHRVQLLAKLFEYERDFFFFFFFNKGFLTTPSFGKFVEELTSQFTYRDGFMLNAGEFNGTSSAWGIIFAGWEIGGTDQREFTFDVMHSTGSGVEKSGQWEGRAAVRANSIGAWLSDVPIDKTEDVSLPTTRNGLDAPNKAVYARPIRDGIGFLHNNGNNVQYSDKYVGLYSMPFASAVSNHITPDNFTRAAVTFSIRRAHYDQIADQNLLWVRDKDIFTRPSDEMLTPEFIADAVVYSLFDRQSRQTSLRDYEHRGRTHRVVNEFFPFSREAINALAVEHRNLSVQRDLDTDRERFVYQWLCDHDDDLSPEARELLAVAWSVYEASFGLRALHAQVHPRYQAESWDAGWLQVRTMAFGRDRMGDTVLPLKPRFDAALKALRVKIVGHTEGIV